MSTDASFTRPLPHPSILAQPFWDGCRRHELVVQHCERCSTFVFYPRATCPHCGARELTWETVSGNATLFTFTIARRPTHRLLADRVPYVIAVVRLDEGPHLTSSVVDVALGTVVIGQRLRVDFEDYETLSIPIFRVVAG